jgi:hypothetical protein
MHIKKEFKESDDGGESGTGIAATDAIPASQTAPEPSIPLPPAGPPLQRSNSLFRRPKPASLTWTPTQAPAPAGTQYSYAYEMEHINPLTPAVSTGPTGADVYGLEPPSALPPAPAPPPSYSATSTDSYSGEIGSYGYYAGTDVPPPPPPPTDSDYHSSIPPPPPSTY